ncbi:MAG: hypothetical protein ACOCRK_09880 [bacterium]
MRIFNIKSIKKEPGVHLPAVLPRKSGKTAHIINLMQPGDLCISPYIRSKRIFEDTYRKSIKLTRASGNLSVTDDNKKFICCLYPRIDSAFLKGHSINTLFIDEFLYYEENRLLKFVNVMSPACFNVIMMGSLQHYNDSNYRFIGSYSVCYDKIGDPEKFNLPDELFVL